VRLKSEIWVQAYIRRCDLEGASAMLVRRGDSDAGAIFIKVNRLDGTAVLFAPAPAGLDGHEHGRRWMACFDGAPVPEADADAYVAHQRAFDADLWVIEVEDREGRHYLDDWL